MEQETGPSTADTFFGLGAVLEHATALVYTVHQMGFKWIYASSTLTSSATNANGTSETATSFSLSDPAIRSQRFTAVKDGTTDIKFYDKSTLVATHTSNLPSGANDSDPTIVVTNKDTATQIALGVRYLSVAVKYA